MRWRRMALAAIVALAGLGPTVACSKTNENMGGSASEDFPRYQRGVLRPEPSQETTSPNAANRPGESETVAARELLVLALEVGEVWTSGGSRELIIEIAAIDAVTGRKVRSFRINSADEYISLDHIFLARDEVVTVSNRRVTRWSLDGQTSATLMKFSPGDRPTSAAVSHDGRMIAVGWEDPELRDNKRGGLAILDLITGRALYMWTMATFSDTLGGWPGPTAWHADDRGLELDGWTRSRMKGRFGYIRFDGTVARREEIVDAIDLAGRMVATIPSGWIHHCVAPAVGAEELVFLEPASGREVGRARMPGYALVTQAFEPQGNDVLIWAAPIQDGPPSMGTKCWTADARQFWLFSLPTGKLEPVADPEAVVTGWRERLLPAVPTVSCPGQEWPAVDMELPWRMSCSGGGEVSVAGRPVATATSGVVLGVVKLAE